MTFLLPKPHSARSERYKQWIRTLPCVICKALAEAAHIGPHGMGIKTDDFRCIPLCHRHHVAGRDSVHQLGDRKFEEVHNVDLKEIQIRLLIRYLIEVLQQDEDSNEYTAITPA